MNQANWKMTSRICTGRLSITGGGAENHAGTKASFPIISFFFYFSFSLHPRPLLLYFSLSVSLLEISSPLFWPEGRWPDQAGLPMLPIPLGKQIRLDLSTEVTCWQTQDHHVDSSQCLYLRSLLLPVPQMQFWDAQSPGGQHSSPLCILPIGLSVSGRKVKPKGRNGEEARVLCVSVPLMISREVGEEILRDLGSHLK